MDAQETVREAPAGFRVIEEGKARILFPDTDGVFYNPCQVFNRDFSVLNLKAFAKLRKQEQGEKFQGLKVLEALAATGLRSMRFALEVPDIASITINDLSPDAVDVIKKNVEFNGLADSTSPVCIPNIGDAVDLMHSRRRDRFDVIDLDPFGSPTVFIDSMVNAVEEGGLLLVTCTDMGVLAGNHPGTCYAKYGAVGCKTPACHEQALRICLGALATAAARTKRHIVPLVSMSVDFYIRVVVRVYTSAAKVKGVATQLAMFHHCTGCRAWQASPLGHAKTKNGNVSYHASSAPLTSPCPHCAYPQTMAGPLWCGPLHNAEYLKLLETEVMEAPETIKSVPGLRGYVRTMQMELEAPMYFALDFLVGTMHCSSLPRRTLIAGLLSHANIRGETYHVSKTHACPRGLKTDAPHAAVWDVMRAWVLSGNPVSKKCGPEAPAHRLMATEGLVDPKLIDFEFPVPEGILCDEPLHLPKPERWGPGKLPKKKALPVTSDKRVAE